MLQGDGRDKLNIMREVLETTKQVVDESLDVAIDADALGRFVDEVAGKDVRIPPWDCHYHYCGDDEDVVAYLLVLDTLNFCFWALPGKSRWEIGYQSKKTSGYFGLAAALKVAVTSGAPILDAEFISRLSLDDLQGFLGGEGLLPLLEKRVENLNELGRVLLQEYDGKAHELVQAAGKSAVRLVRQIADGLSSFRDVASYGGKPVCFYKRAQILTADLYGAFGGKGWGEFSDIGTLTAFADYKVPQVLRHLGVLQYSPALAEKVDHEILLEAGSPEEVEIRAHTIWAIELIRQQLQEEGRAFTASEIDWMLWNFGQDDRYRARPYHRTLTIFY